MSAGSSLQLLCVLAVTASSVDSNALKESKLRKLRGNVAGQQNARDAHIEFPGKNAEVATAKDLLRYIERRRVESGWRYNASSLFLWQEIKGELSKASIGKSRSGELKRFIGKCATAVDVELGLFKAFISDVIRTEEGITRWSFFEFYPYCCCWGVTEVSLFDIRECKPEEQSVLIHEALRRRNETYAGALRQYYKK